MDIHSHCHTVADISGTYILSDTLVDCVLACCLRVVGSKGARDQSMGRALDDNAF